VTRAQPAPQQQQKNPAETLAHRGGAGTEKRQTLK